MLLKCRKVREKLSTINSLYALVTATEIFWQLDGEQEGIRPMRGML